MEQVQARAQSSWPLCLLGLMEALEDATMARTVDDLTLIGRFESHVFCLWQELLNWRPDTPHFPRLASTLSGFLHLRAYLSRVWISNLEFDGLSTWQYGKSGTNSTASRKPCTPRETLLELCRSVPICRIDLSTHG